MGRTFGTSLKGIRLYHGRETTVFSRGCTPSEAPCAMQHWWSGGSFPGYLSTRVRYYVDGTASAVDVPLGLAHGMAPDVADDNGPWSAGQLFGKTGVDPNKGNGSEGSGFFNTFAVPFATGINVTVSLGGPVGGADIFWLILRGRTKAQLMLPGGMPLPATARLRSYEQSAAALAPFAPLPILNTSASDGAVLMVTLAVRSNVSDNFAFLEGQLRAYDGASPSAQPWLLSSGTEDYFLGTFYFDKGQYFLPLAGVTALCPEPSDGAPRPRPPAFGCAANATGVRFSAYRIHASADPLTFEGGFAATWRNGEPGHGRRTPPYVQASAYALFYEW